MEKEILKEKQEEWQYYHPVAKWGKSGYILDASHPLIEKIGPPILVENGNFYLTKFECLMVNELLLLEGGSLIIEKKGIILDLRKDSERFVNWRS